MAVLDDGAVPRGRKPVRPPAKTNDSPGYPSVADIPASNPLRRQAAPKLNDQAISRQPSPNATRKVNGSDQAQRLIDAMPGLDKVKALPGFNNLSDTEKQEVINTYHQTVTVNTSWYKKMDPDRRAMADSRLLNTDVADVRTQRKMTPKPSYAATFADQFMSGVSAGPLGMGYAAVTGEELAPRYEARTNADMGYQMLGAVATTVPLIAGGAALGGARALAMGATPVLAGMASGLGAGLATQIPQQAGAVRLGEKGMLDALKEGTANTLGTTLAGAFNPMQAMLPRNILQTGAGVLGDVAAGNPVTPVSVGTNLAAGIGFDVATAARSIQVPGRGRYRTEVDVPEPDVRSPEVLALPPGSTNVRPMGEAHLNGVPANAEMERQANRIRSGLMLPEPQRMLNAPRERGNPAGAAFDDTRPNTPGVVYAEGSPPFSRQIPQGNTIFAGPAPRPIPKLDPTIPERITALESQAARYREALSRKGGKAARNQKIKDALAQTERQIFDLQLEHLRDNPVPYSPEGAAVRRDIERQVAEQKALRDAGYEKISQANEAGIETDGGLINDATKMQRVRMMSNDQLREQLNKLAPTDTKETFADGISAVTGARDEIARLNDPLTAERLASEYTDMDRAMVAQRQAQAKAEAEARMRSGVTPDEATVKGETADEFFRRKATEAIPEQSPLRRVPLGLAGADEQMASIRAAGDAQRAAADEDIPEWTDTPPVRGSAAGGDTARMFAAAPLAAMAGQSDDENKPWTGALAAGAGALAVGLMNKRTRGPILNAVRAALSTGRIADVTLKGAMRAVGIVDAKGVSRLERPLSKLAQVIYAPANPDSAIGRKVNYIREQALQDFGLDKRYVATRDSRNIQESRIAKQGERLFSKFLADLSPQEQRAVHDILTDENANPAQWAVLRQEVRDYIDELGKRLVQAEGLPVDAYLRNRGQYLARAYKQYEAALPKPSQRLQAVGKQLGIMTSSLKERGTKLDAAVSTIQKQGQPIGTSKAGNPMVRYKGHDWEIVQTKGDRVILKRDWSKAERQQMGEIEHAGYTFLKTVEQMAKNVSSFEMYKAVASDPNIAVSMKTLTEPQIGALVDAGWEHFAGPVKGTGTNRWGALDGHLVEPNVARDLKELDRLQGQRGVYKTLHQWFKKAQTIYNPTTHIYNMLSNPLMLDLQGGNFDMIPDSARAYLGDSTHNDPAWANAVKLAEDNGIFGNNLQDIRKLRIAELDKALSAAQSNNPLEKILNTMRALDEKISGVYGSEDDVFRLALFKQRLDEGMSVDDAAKEARRAFVDYNITAPFINRMRETAFPFLAWSYKALPLIVEGMAKNPWKVAKLALMWQGANAAFSAMAGGNEKEERDAMRGTVKHPSLWMRLPAKDAHGQQRYLDTTRYIPGGSALAGIVDAVEERDPGLALKGLAEQASLGGPAIAAYNALQNVDPNKVGRDNHIVNPILPAGEQIKGRLGYLAQSFVPSGLGYHGDKIRRAFQGVPDQYGRMETPVTAIGGALGVKTRPVVPDELNERFARSQGFAVSEAEAEIRAAYQRQALDPSITDEQLQRQIAPYLRVIEEAQAAMEKRQAQ